jgi:DNA-binding transcriptional LysR family regulator
MTVQPRRAAVNRDDEIALRYDIASLRLFVAVAEEQNMTRAAAREHIVLSAASKRIADLEDAVGAALLHRHARGVSLTEAGQSLLRHARQVIQTLQRMQAELSEYAAGVKGQIRIRATTSAITEFLPSDLHDFTRDHPEIKIDLEEHVGPAVVQGVLEGIAELGILTSVTPTVGLQTYDYHPDHLVLVVPKGHVLGRQRRVKFTDTLDFDFVGPHIDSSLQYVLMQAAAAVDRPLKLRIRVRSFDGMCRMVRANMGIAVLPKLAIEPEARAIGVKCIPIDEPWARRQLQICVRDPAALPLPSRQLLDHLRAAANK